MSLTPKQQRFVEEYLVDFNATQAAVRAKYSAKSAGKIGPELLGKTRIAEAIREEQAKLAQRSAVSAEAVIGELAKLGFANMANYVRIGGNGDPFVDLSKMTRDQAAAIQEVTVEDFVDGRGEDAREVRRVKFKLADKRAALVDLGRHLGIFKDKVEVTGKDGGPIEVTDARERLASAIARLAPDRGAEGSAGKPDAGGS
jgi:phage terminase small subunit